MGLYCNISAVRGQLAFQLMVSAAMVPVAASAYECSGYEKEVSAIVSEATGFQQTLRFQEYGFSPRGGFKSWLDRVRFLQERPEVREFMHKYGYTPMNVYLVADEYRTAGKLDTFFRSIEEAILAGPKCNE